MARLTLNDSLIVRQSPDPLQATFSKLLTYWGQLSLLPSAVWNISSSLSCVSYRVKA